MKKLLCGKALYKKLLGCFLIFFGLLSSVPFMEWFCTLSPFLKYDVRYWEMHNLLTFFYIISFLVIGSLTFIDAIPEDRKK